MAQRKIFIPKPDLLLLNIHDIKNWGIIFVVQSIYKASRLER